MPPANPHALIGKSLDGQYHLQRAIGAGAFAWVYLATTSNGAPVAVKVLQSQSVEARKLFIREIKILRQLPPNPYCVGYVGDGRFGADETPYLVMEYIDGATLKDALKFKPNWDENEACYLMLQLCDALAGLHQLGLAHRDLKPENVMLTRDWQVKLMDFGLVKDAQGLLRLFETEEILTGRDFAENVDRAMLAGTPEYMAPEQFSDPMVDEELAKTDTWTDVYSLGLIFYQLFTGKKLFPMTQPTTGGEAEFARALLTYIRSRTAFTDEMLEQPPEVNDALWTIIARTLRQNPKHRQRTATELAEDLHRYLTTGEGVGEVDFSSTMLANIGDLAALESELDTTTMRGANSAAAGGGGGGDVFETTMSTTTRRRGGGGAAGPWAEELSTIPLDVAQVQAYREQELNKPTAPAAGPGRSKRYATIAPPTAAQAQAALRPVAPRPPTPASLAASRATSDADGPEVVLETVVHTNLPAHQPAAAGVPQPPAPVIHGPPPRPAAQPAYAAPVAGAAPVLGAVPQPQSAPIAAAVPAKPRRTGLRIAIALVLLVLLAGAAYAGLALAARNG